MQLRTKVAISSKRIDVEQVVESAMGPAAGCVVTFVGTVRQTSDAGRIEKMEIEAAKDLAVRDLKRIAGSASGLYDLTAISITHRVGVLDVGEVIVVIAVSVPHREDAFKACQFIIDELKKTTPIWKREFTKAGKSWVASER